MKNNNNFKKMIQKHSLIVKNKKIKKILLHNPKKWIVIKWKINKFLELDFNIEDGINLSNSSDKSKITIGMI